MNVHMNIHVDVHMNINMKIYLNFYIGEDVINIHRGGQMLTPPFSSYQEPPIPQSTSWESFLKGDFFNPPPLSGTCFLVLSM